MNGIVKAKGDATVLLAYASIMCLCKRFSSVYVIKILLMLTEKNSLDALLALM